MWLLRSDGVERGRGLRRLPPPAPLQAQGLDNPAARLFSNPAGDYYGSMVNERVNTSSSPPPPAQAQGLDNPAARLTRPPPPSSSPPPLQAQGLDNPAARLFSNPAGDYGSMVNERVGTSSWENGDELGDTWASRNAYSYGRG